MVKRKGLWILVSVMVLFLAASVYASGVESSGTIITEHCVVRASGNVEAEEIGSLPIGSKVWVEEVKVDWYRVSDIKGTTTGWVYKDMVSLDNVKSVLKSGRVTVSVLNVRSGASTDSSIVSKLSLNEKITIISEEDVWFEISLSNGIKGWVHSEFIQLIPNYPEGIVINETTLKELKDTNSKSLASLKAYDTIYIKDYQDGWLNVILSDFTEGWIDGADGELLATSTRGVNRSGTREGVFADLEAITSKYLGKKYSYGQTGPNSFDCSGFTTYILKTYYSDYLRAKGIDLPRTSRDQSTIGTAVDKASLIAGDLVFFDTVNRVVKTVSHVGIYLGEGRFIHASSSGGNVVISNLDDGYYRQRYLKAVRL